MPQKPNTVKLNTPTQPKGQLSDFERHRRERLKERHRHHRNQLLRQLLKLIILCAIVSFIVWGLLFSKLFHVDTVNYHGLDNKDFPVFVDSTQLDELKSSLTKDSAMSMIGISTKSLEKRVDKIPHVRSSYIVKIWPHQLEIFIDPKPSIGRIGDSFVDRDGTVLGSVSGLAAAISQNASETNNSTANNSTPPTNPPNNGMQLPEVKTSDAAKSDVLLLLEALLPEKLEIKTIEATSHDDIAITHVSKGRDIRVIFGSISNLTLKLADLRMIEDAEEFNGKSTIDISSPQNPVMK